MNRHLITTKAVIPSCVQICMDDLGWFNGEDDRFQGGPSRTAMSRRHTYQDYEAINMLGERLNMKINCAFIMGEWDPDNRLRKIPHISKHKEWDNARFFNKEEAAKCAEAINNSPYIDVAIHGLLHGYYKEGVDNTDTSDWYYREDGELFMIPEQEVRDRLDMFFELLEISGIKKKVNSYIPPSGAYRWGELTKILKDYGVDYSTPVFNEIVFPEDVEVPELVALEDGIVTISRYGKRGSGNNLPWDHHDCDLTNAPLCEGIFGCHWPNFLYCSPNKNSKVIDRNVPYFERNANTFGIILSRDLRFCATMAMFKQYAKLTRIGPDLCFDISEMPKTDKIDNKFIISTKSAPVSSEGCTFKLYETRPGFFNYEITVNPGVQQFKVTF